jgi:hypothetical protein
LANGSITAIPDDTGSAPNYKQVNPDGTVTIYNSQGVSNGSYTPSSGGGGFLGDLFGGLKNAANAITSDPVLGLTAAAMTGGALSNAGLLGTAGAASAPAGLTMDMPLATGGFLGDAGVTATQTITPFSTAAGLASAAAPAATTSAAPVAATAPASGLLADAGASAVPVNTTTMAGVDAASTAAGAASGAAYPGLSTGAGIGAAGGAMTADELLKLASDNKGLIGAALGALGSGNSSTSTTANKDPWAPAQEWMKANLARGQQLQKQYQDNPFSAFQQQAYNNSAGLGNQFRGMVNGMTPQLNAFRPYQRTPQSQVVNPYNFGTSNLGMTTNPFGG